MKIDLIAGARPNMMKIAPLYRALRHTSGVSLRFVHTGQHYDREMSGAFVDDLGLPQPDVFLDVRSGSHAEQTARVMLRYEPYCRKNSPDLVVVAGDINSTLAAALTAKKCGIAVAHLEAGLRSGDRTMPEELNRLATDSISDILWTPSPDADANLLREGHSADHITCVGNVMIDAFEMVAERIAAAGVPDKLGLEPSSYAVVTLHRPSNVDDASRLAALVSELRKCASYLPIVFPLHPRTRARLLATGLIDAFDGERMRAVEPMGYVDFMSLVGSARLIITDSGGLQEEATYLGLPCITVRPNTERPITLTMGTNVLAEPENLVHHLNEKLAGKVERPVIPLWDGAAAERIASDIVRRFHLNPASAT